MEGEVCVWKLGCEMKKSGITCVCILAEGGAGGEEEDEDGGERLPGRQERTLSGAQEWPGLS